jgi:arylsulfatase A-like enzyme
MRFFCFRKDIFFLLFVLSFFSFQCKEQINAPAIAYDLVKELQLPSTIVTGIPSTLDPLAYHWKKNPGRHSHLPIERKWENTQMTFNTDKSIFLNHSLDSLYFAPNSSYTFLIQSGEYELRSLAGLLNQNEKIKKAKGTLVIEADGIEIFKKSFSDTDTETWISLNTKLKLKKVLTISWNSQSDHLFLGEPLLYLHQSHFKPNVILIVIDSARKDFFGSYGFPYQITPNMDTLAKESVFFENPFSNGNWTKPSMMSFFHSEYSSNLGLGNSWFTTKPYQRKVYYGRERPNIASILRKNGYYTKSIMNNVFFLDYTTVGVDLDFHNSYQVGMDILDTKALTDHAIDFVDEMGERPFFLHFNLNTPHASYSPPPEDLQKVKSLIPPEVFYRYESPVQRYIGEMHYTDREVGRLLQTLKKSNQYDNSIIIVTGDHGELFSPHHDYSYHFIMKTRFGHGETHYDEEINVPLFIKLPKGIKSTKSKIEGQSSLLSLLPTILGLLGIDQSSYQFKGIDYSKCIISNEDCPKDKIIYTEGRMSESIRTPFYKYIRRYPGFTTVKRTFDGEPHTMREELYDLQKDPEEKFNLSILPEGVSLLEKARFDFQKGRFLNRNQIHLRLPKCQLPVCRDMATLVVQGSIYDWHSPSQLNIVGSSAKTLNFDIEVGGKPLEIHFDTVNPELEGQFRFYRNGQPLPYRLGKWGIETLFVNATLSKEFILSDRIPLGWEETDLPWIYNDGSFSGVSESNLQKEMGKEVKKILETWGYIHE